MSATSRQGVGGLKKIISNQKRRGTTVSKGIGLGKELGVLNAS